MLDFSCTQHIASKATEPFTVSDQLLLIRAGET